MTKDQKYDFCHRWTGDDEGCPNCEAIATLLELIKKITTFLPPPHDRLIRLVVDQVEKAGTA